MSNPKPDILIVVHDTLRADHASCYGYGRETTPHLDALAEEGVRFTRAITAAPFSPASYASIISNLYPHQHGVNGDTVRIWPDTMPRLPEMMREQGYETFCISSNGFVCAETNSEPGFDTFLGMRDEGRYAQMHWRVFRRIRMHFGDKIAKALMSNRMHCVGKGDSARSMREALRIIDGASTPVFGLIILMDPHTPYDKRRVPDAGGWTPAMRRFFREENDRSMWADMMAHRHMLDDELRGALIDIYDAEVRYSDKCLGMLVQGLRERNRLDRTLLAVTADHGEAFGEHGVWGHGFCLNDCLTRVPLVMRHPGYWQAGTECDAIVQLHDLHDTCLSVATDGRPSVETHPQCLTQAGHSRWNGRDVAFTEFPRQSKTLTYMQSKNPEFEPGVWDHAMWAVRSRDWRLISYENGERALYDLNRDPHETVSVHEAHPEICRELGERIEAHRQDRPYEPTAGDAETEEQIDEAVVERLKALGYIE